MSHGSRPLAQRIWANTSRAITTAGKSSDRLLCRGRRTRRWSGVRRIRQRMIGGCAGYWHPPSGGTTGRGVGATAPAYRAVTWDAGHRRGIDGRPLCAAHRPMRRAVGLNEQQVGDKLCNETLHKRRVGERHRASPSHRDRSPNSTPWSPTSSTCRIEPSDRLVGGIQRWATVWTTLVPRGPTAWALTRSFRALGRIRTSAARFRNWFVGVPAGLLQSCLTCSAPVLVSLRHVQKYGNPPLGWTAGWTTPASAERDRFAFRRVHSRSRARQCRRGRIEQHPGSLTRPWRRTKRGDTRTALARPTRAGACDVTEKPSRPRYSDAAGWSSPT